MADPGRPYTLDNAKRREICVLVAAGYPLVMVAEHVGCSRRTIRRELERNAEFNESFRRAKIAGELEPLSTIRRASRTNWRAAAWYLERLNPQCYGKRNPVMIRPDEVQETINTLMIEVSQSIRREPLRGIVMKKLMRVAGFLEQAINDHERFSGGTRPMNLKDLPNIPGMMPDEIAEMVDFLENGDDDEEDLSH